MKESDRLSGRPGGQKRGRRAHHQMKVGISARYLANGNQRGLNRYAVNLARALAANDGVDVILMSDRPLDSAFDTLVPGRRVVFQGRPHLWWEQALLPRQIGRERLDVFHAPADWGLPYRRVCPQVLTLHSLCSRVLGTPPGAPWKVRIKDALSTWVSIRRADAIIAVSEYVRTDLLRLFGISPERVYVIYEAPDPAFRPLDRTESQPVLEAMGVRQPYFLYVGGFEPWKNLTVLIEAFTRLNRQDLTLVLAGALDGHAAALRALAVKRGIEDLVRFVGYQPDSSLLGLYSRSMALVHPSLYESFGFPLVEAMNCKTPVVASGRGAMREVLGDAALYFDPTDPRCLADTLTALAEDPQLRERLSQAGMERARMFSWERTAKATIDVYETVARQQVRR